MGNASSPARKARTVLGLITAFSVWLTPHDALAGRSDCVPITALKAAEGEREFVHEKRIAGLSKPLISRGQVRVTENQVIWHTATPFDVRTTISQDGVSRSINGGPDRPVRAPFFESNGAMQASFFVSVLNGEWHALHDVFSIIEKTSNGNEPGEIVVVPKSGPPNGPLDRIVASGCRSISQVSLYWSDGSQDLINLVEPSDMDAADTGGS